ncbi:hypothetical protein [Streptomyces anthocyanicus]|uniref:hypothetical protein n=1 Tax=Streptomyces anthocyanicus TaxID=68174 RepID=UPI003814A149
MTTNYDATIRTVADELRRYNPGTSAEEITAYLRRNRNICVTADEVRRVLRTAPHA